MRRSIGSGAARGVGLALALALALGSLEATGPTGTTMGGKVTQHGSPPSIQCKVRFVQIDGENALVVSAPLRDDGTYETGDLPPGRYEYSVVDEAGKALPGWKPKRILVRPGRNVLDIELEPSHRAGASHWKWWAVGGGVAATALAIGISNNNSGGGGGGCDHDVSPSVPGCQR